MSSIAPIKPNAAREGREGSGLGLLLLLAGQALFWLAVGIVIGVYLGR